MDYKIDFCVIDVFIQSVMLICTSYQNKTVIFFLACTFAGADQTDNK